MRHLHLTISLFILGLLCNFVTSSSHAQQFDQAYLKWKAQQEAQDQRLAVQQQEYHYLSKPQLNTSTVSVGGKININQAGVTELQQLNGIGQKKAEAIIQYRQQHGRFQTIEDLQKVKGIGPALLNKNRQRLVL